MSLTKMDRFHRRYFDKHNFGQSHLKLINEIRCQREFITRVLAWMDT